MALARWRHPANTAVKQVWKGTVTTSTDTHIYVLTLTDDDGNTEAVSYTVSSDADVTAVAAKIIAAWNASTIPLIKTAVASAGTAGQVVLTATTAGVPFSVAASSTSGSWSGTGNTTANVGNTDFGTARNWENDQVPVATNDVIMGPGAVGAVYGLNQSSVATESFSTTEGFSGAIGRFENGVLHYLRIDPNSFEIKGSGSLAAIDVGSANISGVINSTGTTTAGKHVVYVKGSDIATLTVSRGNVGIAAIDGETSTVATLNVGYVQSQTSDSNVTVGDGVTLTTVNQSGGVTKVRCAATTLNNNAGTLTTEGTGAVTTINARGTAYPNSTGTVTTINAYGTVDFSLDRTARTVTNLYPKPGCTIVIHSGITVTNFYPLTEPGTFTLKYV